MSTTDDRSKCARCGGRLQDGYVIAPKGLWWDTEPHKFALFTAQLGERILSQWSLTMPSSPAQRCSNCNIVIIQVT